MSMGSTRLAVSDGGHPDDAPVAEEFLGAFSMDSEWVHLRFRLPDNHVLTVPVTAEDFAAIQDQLG